MRPPRGSSLPRPAPGPTEPHPGSSSLPSALAASSVKLFLSPRCSSSMSCGPPWPLLAHLNALACSPRSLQYPDLICHCFHSFCSSQARLFTVPSSLLSHGLFLLLMERLATSLLFCELLQNPRLKLRLLCRDSSQGRCSSLILGPRLL